MNNKNRFIIFSTVIIVLIIVSFSSLIVTANTKVSETIVREGELNNAENPSRKFNDIIENRKVRILIDPGHNAATKGALGYLGYEYYMNLRVARELAKILSEDNKFEYFLSREGAYYSRPIKEYMTNNYEELLGIYNTKVKGEERTGNLTRYQTLELYAIRHYAIDNNFDLLLSIHFDYMPYISRRNKTSGFHVIVSPYNREFPASMQVAYKLSERMQEKYKISPIIGHDRVLPNSVWKFYDREELINNAISLRGLIVIGDAFENAYNKQEIKKDVPSVLIESAFIHEWQFGSNKAVKELANQMYLALVDIYTTK
ncbi:N-acetylmuramoyl-L-alanine amidase [Brachyspira hyodysenteriae]|uniref:N-acetylmuramoyl-L-alanine amidase family protein n=1 Tax=Brachyspira hyodysenteriae TaxID=159 RepID=UPI00063D95CB|nr:N-acetylmuramoyl-L-alanine amidase [Brachyspira hyodysenteriae]KLI27545.1 N-acetylmuramoyl-L-alanine amidase [Brachyspira hyodysenteriae]TVL70598.1 N-acetylmuramoyl-L-alanine amidase [Brachyspira hyodysenteriae]TVL88071.1 N-acetylmuramoyl-L-alanine amidase [Brachyspira hyodysenteriae]